MPSRGGRDRTPPGLLASKADGGVLPAARRGGRTRKAPPGERIERRSRCSRIIRASQSICLKSNSNDTSPLLPGKTEILVLASGSRSAYENDATTLAR